MPQQIVYSNSPLRDLRRILDLLLELERLGLVSGDYDQLLDDLMAKLHEGAVGRFASEALGIEGEYRDDEDYSTPTVWQLYEYVQEEDRPIFIHDLLGVVGACIFQNRWMDNNLVEEIKQHRNLNSYKDNVKVLEDTEVFEKFRYEERTIWFPAECYPSRVGAYEVSTINPDLVHCGFSYWDGKSWYENCILLKDCFEQPKTKSNQRDAEGFFWRGFKEQQID